jgi:hypothetical protein
MESLSRAELLAILGSEAAYTSEAVDAAREELAARKLEPAETEEAPQSDPPPPYEDAGMWAGAAQFFLAASLIGHLVELGSTLLRAPSFGLAVWLVAIDVPTAVVFCCWSYRAAWNVRALNATQLEYSPGAFVGSFFIPIVNLFRPAKAAQELWKASDPSITPNDRAARRAIPNSSLIRAWWLCYVLAGILTMAPASTPAMAVRSALLNVAAIAAILLIAEIQSRQLARAINLQPFLVP